MSGKLLPAAGLLAFAVLLVSCGARQDRGATDVRIETPLLDQLSSGYLEPATWGASFVPAFMQLEASLQQGDRAAALDLFDAMRELGEARELDEEQRLALELVAATVGLLSYDTHLPSADEPTHPELFELVWRERRIHHSIAAVPHDRRRLVAVDATDDASPRLAALRSAAAIGGRSAATPCDLTDKAWAPAAREAIEAAFAIGRPDLTISAELSMIPWDNPHLIQAQVDVFVDRWQNSPQRWAAPMALDALVAEIARRGVPVAPDRVCEAWAETWQPFVEPDGGVGQADGMTWPAFDRIAWGQRVCGGVVRIDLAIGQRLVELSETDDAGRGGIAALAVMGVVHSMFSSWADEETEQSMSDALRAGFGSASFGDSEGPGALVVSGVVELAGAYHAHHGSASTAAPRALARAQTLFDAAAALPEPGEDDAVAWHLAPLLSAATSALIGVSEGDRDRMLGRPDVWAAALARAIALHATHVDERASQHLVQGLMEATRAAFGAHDTLPEARAALAAASSMSDQLDGPWIDVATVLAWDAVAYAARDEREAHHGRAALERLGQRVANVPWLEDVLPFERWAQVVAVHNIAMAALSVPPEGSVGRAIAPHFDHHAPAWLAWMNTQSDLPALAPVAHRIVLAIDTHGAAAFLDEEFATGFLLQELGPLLAADLDAPMPELLIGQLLVDTSPASDESYALWLDEVGVEAADPDDPWSWVGARLSLDRAACLGSESEVESALQALSAASDRWAACGATSMHHLTAPSMATYRARVGDLAGANDQIESWLRAVDAGAPSSARVACRLVSQAGYLSSQLDLQHEMLGVSTVGGSQLSLGAGLGSDEGWSVTQSCEWVEGRSIDTELLLNLRAWRWAILDGDTRMERAMLERLLPLLSSPEALRNMPTGDLAATARVARAHGLADVAGWLEEVIAYYDRGGDGPREPECGLP